MHIVSLFDSQDQEKRTVMVPSKTLLGSTQGWKTASISSLSLFQCIHHPQESFNIFCNGKINNCFNKNNEIKEVNTVIVEIGD